MCVCVCVSVYVYVCVCYSDAVVSVSASDIPHHLEAMVELLCEEDSQKNARERGTMVSTLRRKTIAQVYTSPYIHNIILTQTLLEDTLCCWIVKRALSPCSSLCIGVKGHACMWRTVLCSALSLSLCVSFCRGRVWSSCSDTGYWTHSTPPARMM